VRHKTLKTLGEVKAESGDSRLALFVKTPGKEKKRYWVPTGPPPTCQQEACAPAKGEITRGPAEGREDRNERKEGHKGGGRRGGEVIPGGGSEGGAGTAAQSLKDMPRNTGPP